MRRDRIFEEFSEVPEMEGQAGITPSADGVLEPEDVIADETDADLTFDVDSFDAYSNKDFQEQIYNTFSKSDISVGRLVKSYFYSKNSTKINKKV